MESKRHKLIIRTLPILLLAFALRIWGLADHNIWWDEGIGVWLARMPVLEAIDWTAGDVHPPLYYVVLRAWRLWAGEGEFVLRYPSVLFSLLTVPVIYQLGRRLGGIRAGLLAALCLTVSRFAVWWAQEIRMYALAALFAAGSLWSTVRLWRDPPRGRGWRPWVAYVVTTLGSFYTLYLTVTVGAVTNLGFLIAWWHGGCRRRTAIRWITAQLAVAALTLPWLIIALPRMHSWSSDAPFTPGFFIQLYATILAVGSPLDLQSYRTVTAAAFVALGPGLLALVRRRSGPLRRGGLAMLLAGLLLPPLVVMMVSLPGLRFYFSRPLVPRYLLPLAACYTTVAAWGNAALSRTRRALSLGMAGVTLVAALAGLVAFYPGRARRDDYPTIAEVLTALRQPGDAVVLYVDRDWPIFTAHYAGARQDLPYGADYRDDGFVEGRLAPIWEQATAVWLVTTPESLQADPDRTVPRWLAARAAFTETVVTGEATLTFYARTEERAQAAFRVVPSFTPPITVGAPLGLRGVSIPLPRYRTGDTLHLGFYWSGAPPEGARVAVGPREVRVMVGDLDTVAGATTTRSQIDVPLTPDLPGGRYTVTIDAAGDPPLRVGTFTVLRAAAGTSTTTGDIPYPIEYRFGESITLVGYALPETVVAAGGVVPLTLYWRADAPVVDRYKVFTHLVGETFNAGTGNFLWGQQDNEPVSGQAPTTLWAPGSVIADAYLLPVDPAAPPGTYTLEVGLYGLVDGVRMAVAGPGGPLENDAVLLATVAVRASP